MYVIIAYVIQFDKLFYPVVLYENYLNCIVMNIHVNLKKMGKSLESKKVSNDMEVGPR